MSVHVTLTQLHPGLVAFLHDTPAGSPGGIQVRDALLHLDAIPDALWFEARDGDRLLGAYALVPRTWGFWRCHMTVGPERRSEVIEALVRAVLAHVPEDAVVAGGCEDSHVLLADCLRGVGYDEAGESQVLVWSKRAPDASVTRATPTDLGPLERSLDARDVHWCPPATFDDVYVLRRADRVVASTRLHPLAWHVDSLGPGSTLTRPLLRLSGVPLDPLQFGAFVDNTGEPDHLADLWSAVLHQRRLPMALVGADTTDPRWARWRALSRGWLGRLLGISTQRVFSRGRVPSPLDWTTDFLR
jgi:hypothetical protein